MLAVVTVERPICMPVDSLPTDLAGKSKSPAIAALFLQVILILVVDANLTKFYGVDGSGSPSGAYHVNSVEPKSLGSVDDMGTRPQEFFTRTRAED